MKKTLFVLISILLWVLNLRAEVFITVQDKNAVRIQITSENYKSPEELVFINNLDPKYKRDENAQFISIKTQQFTLLYDKSARTISLKDPNGRTLLQSLSLQNIGKASFVSPKDEFLCGLGQFQDGYLNIRGLTRCLTQVNTQISIPLLLSNKGYAILWHNYGKTEFNPSSHTIELQRSDIGGQSMTVNATSTTGNLKEQRDFCSFVTEIETPKEGDYSLIFNVGQKMARKHYVAIDGMTIEDINNIWLPPTTSFKLHLTKGKHKVEFQGVTTDKPTLGWRYVDDTTTFSSTDAQATDFTIFIGNADNIIASYRRLTGNAPMMPKWALGYIHCRERYNTQQELLSDAAEFRKRNIPIDMIVQDWQYWGKYGWNAMRFDEDKYPDPKLMVDSLHKENIRLMVSVWAKISRQSEVGKQADSLSYFIPNTDWIDFFNPKAAGFYWNKYSSQLLKPYGIDAWWQDATEPENDDLHDRWIHSGKLKGDDYRNVFPLFVNKTVYEGLRKDNPSARPMILTRSAFLGMQRYGAATWSGDVGNDWETFRRQIVAGLGMMASGLPWWTYDAGGFFRPSDQYTDNDYQERMIRWIQTATFLPLMRVHGYKSNTEPWRYSETTSKLFEEAIRQRYELLPYIYSEASQVTFNGGTLMRPLIMDYPSDQEALKEQTEYMFGPSLLIVPITLPHVTSWNVYLPEKEAGWIDFHTGKHYKGRQHINIPINMSAIPMFVKAGTILPLSKGLQYSSQKSAEPMEIRIYPGADASFTLYEDDGVSNDYEQGSCSRITFRWDDSSQKLNISSREGDFKGMEKSRPFLINIVGKFKKTVQYEGKTMTTSPSK